MKLSAVNNIHFTRKTEAANNIARPLLQANNYQSCDTVSFGMASILQKELYSFNKKNYYFTPDRNGDLPIHGADAKKTKVILDAYKDDKETLAKMLLKINENGLQNKYELVIKTVEKLVFETSEISYKDSLELAKLYADKSERLKAAIPFLESKVETSR